VEVVSSPSPGKEATDSGNPGSNPAPASDNPGSGEVTSSNPGPGGNPKLS